MKGIVKSRRAIYLALAFSMMFAFGGCENSPVATVETTETIVETEAADVTVPVTETSAETKPTQEVTPTTAPVQTEPPHNHSYCAISTTSPTCERQGYTTYKCACGSSYNENYTAAPGHSYSSKGVDPTTESKGYTQYTCSRCAHSYKDNYTDMLPKYTEKEYEQLIKKYVLQHLNEHRAAVGAPALKSLSGMSKVADYRADQLTHNFDHDTNDIRQAHAHYQYGRYVDATSFGQDTSYSYYTADAGEAICSVWDYNDPQRVAKEIADGFRASSPHWSYLGSAENIFAGIGLAFHNNYCYGCIMVGCTNYG